MAGSEYVGKNITIRFDGEKCIHSRMCVLGHPEVFQANVKGPWINPDNAPVESLAAVARNCPSGAITYLRNDGGLEENPPSVNSVRVLENGPVAICGDIRLNGDAIGFRATMCRCGASQNKPFCDGSHTKSGFEATGEVPSNGDQSVDDRSGPLEIRTITNGPLSVTGGLEVIAGTGRRVTTTTKTSLCRCGQSNNKPFCDGTHAKIGFAAD